jgi:fatty-acyl-CoA synthase
MSGLINDWVQHHARVSPTKTATVELASGRRHSYAEMHDRVGRIARMIRDAGVKPGDRVGVLALNSSDILDIVCATWRIGAIHLALNFRLTATELAYILSDAGSKLVFADSALRDTLDALKPQTPSVSWLELDGHGGDSPFESAIRAASPVQESVDRKETDQALLMYSSGTTGRPKGVIISHGMVMAGMLNLIIPYEFGRRSVSYAVLPLFHIGGLMGFSLPALFMGATAVIARAFEPGAMLADISNRELGVSHFLGLPALYNAMRLHPDNPTSDLSRIRIAAGGAEPMPVALMEWWSDRGLPILEVYGMTETVGLACGLLPEDLPERLGSAGRTSFFTHIRIVAPDGTDVPTGEAGEIWMKGANVTSAYWRKPEANEECFTEGWLHSGDMGRMDADGFIYIEDRIKDMYISGGENIYPSEVESVLFQLKQIQEVAVVGVPDEKWGEVGCAFVVLREGASLDLEAIAKHCSGQLAQYKYPRHLEFVDALPRNATGKVQKFRLREMLREKSGA